MKRFYIYTWGCQMNEHKSEGMAGVLVRAGYLPADDPAHADVVLFNTCMVREKPVEKVYSEAGVIALLKEKNPDLILGVGAASPKPSKRSSFSAAPRSTSSLGAPISLSSQGSSSRCAPAAPWASPAG
jgi:tRNA-2-methylthio-N6-dimethylallyladenosine synthase